MASLYNHVQSFWFHCVRRSLRRLKAFRTLFSACWRRPVGWVTHTLVYTLLWKNTHEPQWPNVEQVIWSATRGLLDQIPAQAVNTELKERNVPALESLQWFRNEIYTVRADRLFKDILMFQVSSNWVKHKNIEIRTTKWLLVIIMCTFEEKSTDFQ